MNGAWLASLCVTICIFSCIVNPCVTRIRMVLSASEIALMLKGIPLYMSPTLIRKTSFCTWSRYSCHVLASTDRSILQSIWFSAVCTTKIKDCCFSLSSSMMVTLACGWSQSRCKKFKFFVCMMVLLPNSKIMISYQKSIWLCVYNKIKTNHLLN